MFRYFTVTGIYTLTGSPICAIFKTYREACAHLEDLKRRGGYIKLTTHCEVEWN